MLESSCFPVGVGSSSVGDLRMVPFKTMRMVGLHVSGDKQKSAPLAMEILERPSKSKVLKQGVFLNQNLSRVRSII